MNTSSTSSRTRVPSPIRRALAAKSAKDEEGLSADWEVLETASRRSLDDDDWAEARLQS